MLVLGILLISGLILRAPLLKLSGFIFFEDLLLNASFTLTVGGGVCLSDCIGGRIEGKKELY